MMICTIQRYFLVAILSFSFFLSITTVQAQRYRRQAFGSSKRYTSIGVMVSATNYFGDIVPRSSFTSADLQFTRPSFGGIVSRRISPRVSVRGSFAWARIKGDDFVSASSNDANARFRYVRNLSFRNDIYELAGTISYDFIPNNNIFYKRPKWVPYAFIGVAGFYHNPKARFSSDEADLYGSNTNWVALQPLGTEGQGIDGKKRYSLLQIAIPFGLGVRYKLTDHIDISFEVGMRQTFTDYLDDVSGNYPGTETLKQMTPLARAFSARSLATQSSNGSDRDINSLATYLYGPDYAKQFYDNQYAVNGHGVDSQQKGEQRGNPKEKDQYLLTGFHVSYIIFKGVRCPKF